MVSRRPGSSSWLILPTAMLALATAPLREATVAAPAIIIVHGAPLPQRVVMSDFDENLRLMAAIDVSQRSDSSLVEGRGYLGLAMFWGPEWATYPRTPEALGRLRPEQANQHGRFYPAQGDSPALVLIGPAFGRGYTTLGQISESGLAVLARHDIPNRLGERRGPA
jgi:hypothetical protein